MNNVEMLSFELLERIIRLHAHIERSCLLASVPGTRPTAQMKNARELQAHLIEIVSMTRSHTAVGSEWSPEVQVNYLHKAIEQLSAIHTQGLIRIPRPHEPIELVSFLRQTLMHASKEDLDDESFAIPDIFATEVLLNQAHFRFAVEDARQQIAIPTALEGSLIDFANDNGLGADHTPHKIKSISLPRIDLSNPCKWPSLLHEVGHSRISNGELRSQLIEAIGSDRYGLTLKWMAPFASSEDSDSCESELLSWLSECWCDAYVVIQCGPAAFFAQLHAFIFSHPCYLTEKLERASGYPPAWFRLKLLLTLSEARLDNEDEEMRNRICLAMENEKRRVYQLFDFKVKFDQGLASLQAVFSEFLRCAFPREDFPANTHISSFTLNRLIADLEQGLPIPSVPLSKNTKKQRAASAPEILLAGWLHRLNGFRTEFIEMMRASDSVDQTMRQLLAKVGRSDETLKRSIQMSEWFNILHGGPDKSDAEIEFADCPLGSSMPGLLSDRDINALISSEELRIIPLIDAVRQVRGSVVDVRLGHNFEIFYSNVPRVIDPLQNVISGEEHDSMEMDVDFLEGMEVGPGQFILAHTLEYLKLPPNVAGQIEGRSSFARLGLQVHMTANLVEAGFDGCLTLEIANSGPSTIKLYPGMRIAQLRFFRLASTPQYPYGKAEENKYRGRLSHNKTKQFSDWEVDAIEAAKSRFRPRKVI